MRKIIEWLKRWFYGTKKAGTVGIQENVTIEVKDSTTGETKIIQAKNVITNVGLNLVRDLISNSSRELSHIAVGTDATAPAITDTILNAEVWRDYITRRITTTDYVWKAQLFIDEATANGNTLQEAGLFNRSVGGSMLSRVTYDPIVKTAAITATLTWEITIARA